MFLLQLLQIQPLVQFLLQLLQRLLLVQFLLQLLQRPLILSWELMWSPMLERAIGLSLLAASLTMLGLPRILLLAIIPRSNALFNSTSS